jgi:hypothetical protein
VASPRSFARLDASAIRMLGEGWNARSHRRASRDPRLTLFPQFLVRLNSSALPAGLIAAALAAPILVGGWIGSRTGRELRRRRVDEPGG